MPANAAASAPITTLDQGAALSAVRLNSHAEPGYQYASNIKPAIVDQDGYDMPANAAASAPITTLDQGAALSAVRLNSQAEPGYQYASNIKPAIFDQDGNGMPANAAARAPIATLGKGAASQPTQNNEHPPLEYEIPFGGLPVRATGVGDSPTTTLSQGAALSVVRLNSQAEPGYQSAKTLNRTHSQPQPQPHPKNNEHPPLEYEIPFGGLPVRATGVGPPSQEHLQVEGSEQSSAHSSENTARGTRVPEGGQNTNIKQHPAWSKIEEAPYSLASQGTPQQGYLQVGSSEPSTAHSSSSNVTSYVSVAPPTVVKLDRGGAGEKHRRQTRVATLETVKSIEAAFIVRLSENAGETKGWIVCTSNGDVSRDKVELYDSKAASDKTLAKLTIRSKNVLNVEMKKVRTRKYVAVHDTAHRSVPVMFGNDDATQVDALFTFFMKDKANQPTMTLRTEPSDSDETRL
jgi:hypothetical protein